MNWKLAFSIASTHLLTKKRQSIIAMLGVTFGISMFIIMISFMTGVNKFMEDMAMDNTPHIRIYKPIELKDKKIIAEGKPNGATDWYVLEHQRPKNELSKIKNGLIVELKFFTHAETILLIENEYDSFSDASALWDLESGKKIFGDASCDFK